MSTSSKLAALVLGPDRSTRNAAYLCVSSFVGYILYGAVAAVQVHYGFADGLWVAWNCGAALAVCAVFYLLIRSGLAMRIRWDPTLGRSQLAVGIAFFWTTYALSGPAAPATTIILASHIVYAMFGMPARHVWGLVAGSLSALGLIMIGCHALQPARYPAGQQVVSLLYTTLVVILVAQLASRVTHMQESLREQRARLEQALGQVKRLAECDALTQLPNRRTTAGLLENVLANSGGQRGIGCLALLDIDHFKRVNDTLGHAAGDEVLRGFAQVCRSAIRDGDHFGRWGGEEFVLFMPRADLAAAQSLLERLRALVTQTDFVWNNRPMRVSFSAGIARHRKGEGIEACMDRADQALYCAKQAGRDRVECAPAAAPANARPATV